MSLRAINGSYNRSSRGKGMKIVLQIIALTSINDLRIMSNIIIFKKPRFKWLPTYLIFSLSYNQTCIKGRKNDNMNISS